ALAELTGRYYRGHGPATVKDFAWWSGLTVTEAKTGIAMVGDRLRKEVIDEETYWFSEEMGPAEPCQEAFLLPTFDEFLVGFAGFDKSRRGGHIAKQVGNYDSTIVIGGNVVGSWRRTFSKGEVIIEFEAFRPLSDTEVEAIQV